MATALPQRRMDVVEAMRCSQCGEPHSRPAPRSTTESRCCCADARSPREVHPAERSLAAGEATQATPVPGRGAYQRAPSGQPRGGPHAASGLERLGCRRSPPESGRSRRAGSLTGDVHPTHADSHQAERRANGPRQPRASPPCPSSARRRGLRATSRGEVRATAPSSTARPSSYARSRPQTRWRRWSLWSSSA